MSKIEPSFLKGRNILFVADKQFNVFTIDQKDFITDGSVVSVDEERNQALVCFLYHGYKSATENVPFSHILSVVDEKNGSPIKIDRFSGTGHDLRGKEPFGSHALARAA